jgi:LysM repeat protein
MNSHKTTFVRLIAIAALLAILSTTVGAAFAANGTHTVQPGDTLTKIARLYNTTVTVLVDTNKVQFPCLATNAACLQVGWVITVPGGSVTTPGTVTTNPGTYTVQANDSLSKIASKFGVTFSALVNANKASRPCLANTPACPLQIGWVLTIPGGAKPSTTTTNANTTAPTGDPAVVIGQYVAALNARNAAGIKALLHPDFINASTDTFIEELFRFSDIYKLTFTANESRVISQSATQAEVFFVITSESGNFDGFGTDVEATVLLKPYQGTWRIYDEAAGRLELVR